MNTENKPPIGCLSPEEIEELEAKYKGAYSIESNGHIAYFRKPNRHTQNIVLSKIDKDSKPLDFFEYYAKECFVAGSDELINDDDMFLDLVEALKDKIGDHNAVLVNL